MTTAPPPPGRGAGRPAAASRPRHRAAPPGEAGRGDRVRGACPVLCTSGRLRTPKLARPQGSGRATRCGMWLATLTGAVE